MIKFKKSYLHHQFELHLFHLYLLKIFADLLYQQLTISSRKKHENDEKKMNSNLFSIFIIIFVFVIFVHLAIFFVSSTEIILRAFILIRIAQTPSSGFLTHLLNFFRSVFFVAESSFSTPPFLKNCVKIKGGSILRKKFYF